MKMKKALILTGLLALLVLIILIIAILKIVSPQKPQGIAEYIPLDISLYNSDIVEWFNNYARDTDLISARPDCIDLLDDVKVGKKILVFTHQSDPQEMISLAKEKGIKIIGYNLEGPFSKEELISKEKEVYELAKENGLLFVFGPTVVNLEKYYEDFVQYADVIVLQSQRYQTEDNYEEVVEELIEKIKSANPNVKVRVVVSVSPPSLKNGQVERVYFSADQVIDNIHLIQDKADSIFIFSFPTLDPSNVMEEVFKKLRE